MADSATEYNSDQRRTMHEILTWLESGINAFEGSQYGYRVTPPAHELEFNLIEAAHTLLSAAAPRDLCLHIDPCEDYIHT